MTETKIFWRNAFIGTISDEQIDMWYCNCKWKNNESEEAIAFTTLASNFDPKEIMITPEKGTRVILKRANSDGPTNAIVLSLADDDLFIRYVYDETAIAWLEKNVY